MKIGIEFKYDLVNIDANLKKFKDLKLIGFDAIDLDLSNTETLFYTLENEEFYKLINRIKTQIHESGLFINQTHGPWICPPIKDYTTEGRKERMEKMKKGIKITALLGVKYFVIHPIMPFGCDNIPLETYSDNFNMNIEYYTELTKYAESENVIICYENMPFNGYPISKCSEILSVVKTIDSDNFKICLDTGHAMVMPDNSLEDSVKELSSLIKVLHVHDNDGKGDQHKFPGLGVIHWQAFIDALKEINYDGVFSLETLPDKNLPEEEYLVELQKLYNIASNLIN